MKKRWFALLIVILALVFCVGITGYAEGEEGTVPAGTEEGPAVPSGGETPGGETGGETPGGETPETTPPAATEAPVVTAPPVITEAPVMTPAPTATVPVILKNPGAEVVKSGESCLFIAKADNYTGVNWYFTKGDQIIYMSEASSKFPGLGVSGDGTEVLTLTGVPESLDGWNIGAVFTNAVGKQGTTTCSITVTTPEGASPAATSSPKPTVVPTSTPRPAVTLAPTPSPAGTSAASVSPTPTAAPEKAERGGSIFGLLLLVLLLLLFLGGAAALFILYRSGRLGKTSGKSVKTRRYDEYDDDEDDDDDDDYNEKRSYRGRH